MIIQLLLQIIISALNVITSFLPKVETLPFGMDYILDSGMQYFRTVMVSIPPLETLLTATMVLFSYKLGMIILKIFLGSRTPKHE